MRASHRTIRRRTVGALALGALVLVVHAMLAGWSPSTSAHDSIEPNPNSPIVISSSITTSTSTNTTTTVVPVEVLPATPAFATGNEQLDALLTSLPAVLFEGGAQVHVGYNPVDCCHAGGYNPEPNEVWVGDAAFADAASLTYVTAHELAHSVHLKSGRAAALTAAVTGAPVVRAGSPWDDSEKVADCVAWALFPAETAASGLIYWHCPEPYRSQVVAALR